MPATEQQLRQAYEAKVADFAAETRKTSILIQALRSMGCTGSEHQGNCPGCAALREAGVAL